MEIYIIVHLQGDSCAGLYPMSSEREAVEEATKIAKRFGYEFFAGHFWKSDYGSVEVNTCKLDAMPTFD